MLAVVCPGCKSINVRVQIEWAQRATQRILGGEPVAGR
jgi:hypothetical protein